MNVSFVTLSGVAIAAVAVERVGYDEKIIRASDEC
jgi:hypothetical protein